MSDWSASVEAPLLMYTKGKLLHGSFHPCVTTQEGHSGVYKSASCSSCRLDRENGREVAIKVIDLDDV